MTTERPGQGATEHPVRAVAGNTRRHTGGQHLGRASGQPATRAVLFDIDGTLVSAGPLGAEVFDRAIEAVTGQAPPLRVSMSGKTDPQIVREYMEAMHLDVAAHLSSVLARLEHELALAGPELPSMGRTLPGVVALLEALAEDRRFHLSVLTGNIAPNAAVKLGAFGLDRWLDLETGAYGSDSERRTELVPIALRRLASLRGAHLEPQHAWVVGDTPRDLDAARVGGARCVLVATGRFGLTELERLEPDAVLADLSDTQQVVKLLSDGL